MSSLGPAEQAIEPNDANACSAGLSYLGASDDAEYDRRRQAARERMAAIVAAMARRHAEEMASARRPSAIESQNHNSK